MFNTERNIKLSKNLPFVKFVFVFIFANFAFFFYLEFVKSQGSEAVTYRQIRICLDHFSYIFDKFYDFFCMLTFLNY